MQEELYIINQQPGMQLMLQRVNIMVHPMPHSTTPLPHASVISVASSTKYCRLILTIRRLPCTFSLPCIPTYIGCLSTDCYASTTYVAATDVSYNHLNSWML